MRGRKGSMSVAATLALAAIFGLSRWFVPDMDSDQSGMAIGSVEGTSSVQVASGDYTAILGHEDGTSIIGHEDGTSVVLCSPDGCSSGYRLRLDIDGQVVADPLGGASITCAVSGDAQTTLALLERAVGVSCGSGGDEGSAGAGSVGISCGTGGDEGSAGYRLRRGDGGGIDVDPGGHVSASLFRSSDVVAACALPDAATGGSDVVLTAVSGNKLAELWSGQ